MDEILEKLEDLSISEKPKMPKGKRTAYMCFMKYTSAEMKKKGETFKGVGQFSKICSKKWKEISNKEKEKFQQMADEDTERFDREMAEYEKAKNNYDKFIDEVHRKGFLNNLDDERKIADLLHCPSANKSVHFSLQEKDRSSDGQTSDDSPANDTLEEEDKEDDEEETEEESDGEEDDDEGDNEEETEDEEESDHKETKRKLRKPGRRLF